MSGIGREFLEKTKYHNLGLSDQMRGLPQPPLQQGYDASEPGIELSRPETTREKSLHLQEAIERRRSIRQYSQTPISLEELSFLLWCTQGVRQVIPESATLRNVPSAGARHAFETYLLLNSVEKTRAGLYRYVAIEHLLVQKNIAPDIADRAVEACLGQNFVKSSAVTFFWTADVYRMKWRYGERGYRYLFIDAGHVCQNLYLCSLNIDCGVCAIAAFSDDDVNGLLKLDGKEQFVIYIATVGKK
jgi:SagB-type dehydrogenase family enzyme